MLGIVDIIAVAMHTSNGIVKSNAIISKSIVSIEAKRH
jgi:hypothetical protein